MAEPLASIWISVRAKDVVFVKGLIEAHEGVAQVRAESGGELELVAPVSRMAELREIVVSFGEELGLLLRPPRDAVR